MEEGRGDKETCLCACTSCRLFSVKPTSYRWLHSITKVGGGGVGGAQDKKSSSPSSPPDSASFPSKVKNIQAPRSPHPHSSYCMKHYAGFGTRTIASHTPLAHFLCLSVLQQQILKSSRPLFFFSIPSDSITLLQSLWRARMQTWRVRMTGMPQECLHRSAGQQ